jgi:hypothetical protein
VFGPAVGDTPVFDVVDGIDVPADMGFDDWKVGGITVHHRDPLQGADVTFEGADASLAYRFDAIHPAYAYGANAGGCPWYLAADRFEQSGTVSGSVTVGGRTIDYDATGHRDHSWGTRNWGAIQHWKWILAQTGDDVGVHVMETVALGERRVFGYVSKGRVHAEVTGIEDLRFELDPDLMHRSVDLVAVDDAGRRTELSFRRATRFVFPVSPTCTMHEVSMHATVDGVAGPGHVEMGWPKAYLEQAQADEGVRSHLQG